MDPPGPAHNQPSPVMAAALKDDSSHNNEVVVQINGMDHPPIPPLGAGPEPTLLTVGAAQLGDVDPDDGDDEMKKAFSRRFFPRYGYTMIVMFFFADDGMMSGHTALTPFASPCLLLNLSGVGSSSSSTQVRTCTSGKTYFEQVPKGLLLKLLEDPLNLRLP
jgi:hypothetical protein